MSTSTLVRKDLPCKACGSSDALAEYSDGHTYCFSCKTHDTGRGFDDPAPERSSPAGLCQTSGLAKPFRGISNEAIKRYDYRTGVYAGKTVQVATYVHPQTGEAVGQKLRFEPKDFTSLGNMTGAPFWGQHLFPSGNRLYITEGEIDCLTVATVRPGWPVVSLPGGSGSAAKTIKDNLSWLSGFGEIVLVFDSDAPGREALEVAVRLLPPDKLKVVTGYPGDCKDINATLEVHGNKAAFGVLMGAGPYRDERIISAADLWQQMIAPNVRGIPVAYPGMDDMTDGYRPGEITLIGAGTGVGKSTIVQQEVAHLTALGHKVGVLALEERPRRTGLRYLSYFAGKQLHLTYDESFESYKGLWDEHCVGKLELFDHWGSLASDELINRIRYMVLALDCRFICLDHISIVVSGLTDQGQSERLTIDHLMTRLRSLAEETGAHFLVVSHLKRIDGTPHEEGGQVSLSHYRGSGSLAQLSDNIWGFERNSQADDEEQRHVIWGRSLKCRYTGRTGKVGACKYDTHTGRLTPYHAPQENTSDVPF
jgi:twinkle protein